MLIKGENADNIKSDDSFSKDGFPNETFDYMLANPPFGVEWKQQKQFIEKEHKTMGYDGWFGAGLPRINDGALLFLQHMISKMRSPQEGGSRIGIVFNGSPLFTGDAGSGESEIRHWIIENDWLEGIVPLKENIEDYFEKEVFPHVPDAWIDHSKTKVGFEIPLTRHFYRYEPPRPLEEIQEDLAELEKNIVRMLKEVVA